MEKSYITVLTIVDTKMYRQAMPKAVRRHLYHIVNMSYYESTQDYSPFDNSYPEVTINYTYHYLDEDDAPEAPADPAGGAWDDYQNERENIISNIINSGNSR